MTIKKSSATVKKAEITSESNIPVNGTILAVNESILKAVSVYASSVLFSQPQFATQITPNNIVSLADLFYKYMTGSVDVKPVDSEPSTTTFG